MVGLDRIVYGIKIDQVKLVFLLIGLERIVYRQ